MAYYRQSWGEKQKEEEKEVGKEKILCHSYWVSDDTVCKTHIMECVIIQKVL